jgi:hypothetical protein
MDRYALITGASRGIGLAFAEILAKQGYDLLLIARDETKLAAIQKRLQDNFHITVVIFPVDLSVSGSSQSLIDFVLKNNIAVHVLINNAGFGYFGGYFNLSLARELEMINLNIVSVVYLTRYFLGSMLKSGSGIIINVASTAAFAPRPYAGSYSASKSYLLSYTESLAGEFKGSGVKLMALCPGPTRTEFHRQSGDMVSDRELNLMPAAEKVAEYGWRSLRKKQVVVIYGWRNKLFIVLARIIPRGRVRNILSFIKRSFSPVKLKP